MTRRAVRTGAMHLQSDVLPVIRSESPIFTVTNMLWRCSGVLPAGAERLCAGFFMALAHVTVGRWVSNLASALPPCSICMSRTCVVQNRRGCQ